MVLPLRSCGLLPVTAGRIPYCRRHQLMLNLPTYMSKAYSSYISLYSKHIGSDYSSPT